MAERIWPQSILNPQENRAMQSRLFGVFVASLTLAVSTPFLLGQDSAPQGQQRPRRPLPKPTNLQVLPKDIQPEQLIHIMRGVAGSLGVECNFCHEIGRASC